MSAERLRAAATLLRERAEAATPGPWEVLLSSTKHAYGVWSLRGECVTIDRATSRKHVDGANASFVATMDPTVALAVADWLDWMADRSASGNGIPAMRGQGLAQALAVADAILAGGAS